MGSRNPLRIRRSRTAALGRGFCFAAIFALACQRPAPAPPHAARRVVTLAPNVTEMIYALGSGRSIVGTDDFSDYPNDAKTKPRVGGMQPDIEKIVSLNPDLVFATTNGNHPSLAPALASVHLPLHVVVANRLADIAPAMEKVADALASPNRNAIDELRRALLAQHRVRTKKPRVLFVVWTSPLYVAGHNTFSDDLIALVGAENAIPSGIDGWPQLSLETLVAHPPDLMLYPDREVTSAQMQQLLAAAPGVHARVVPVDENVFTRPGPRVAEAAARLNAILDAWEHAP